MSFLHQILEFYDAPAAASFDLPPEQAIAYFRAKGLRITFNWRDMVGEEHANAFTVAKMADVDLLADIQASLDDAIAQGLSYESWAQTITPLLQQKGWWGRKAVTDPLTGATVVAQLGSPSRLRTIFRTNVQGSYAAGHWEQIQANADIAEYLMYDAVDDHRTRPEHAAWDGTILPVDHKWWTTHYPPNGWNCRCGVIQMSAEELDDLGLEASARAPRSTTRPWQNPRNGRTRQVPVGLDPGWDVNQGAERLKTLEAVAQEKIRALPPPMAIAAARGMKAARRQANQLAEAARIALAPKIDKTPSKIARGAGAAAQRAARAAINRALRENTRYLAAEIRRLQRTKAGKEMDAVTLLATAQEAARRRAEAAGAAVDFAEALGPIVSVQALTFGDEASRAQAITALRELGHHTWPDGRPLEAVMTTATGD